MSGVVDLYVYRHGFQVSIAAVVLPKRCCLRKAAGRPTNYRVERMGINMTAQRSRPACLVTRGGGSASALQAAAPLWAPCVALGGPIWAGTTGHTECVHINILILFEILRYSIFELMHVKHCIPFIIVRMSSQSSLRET